MVAASNSSEITLTRVYDAPVETVWQAWTDPAAVAQWWGPRGFTLTTHSKDLRPGGIWHYTMHGPDGTDYENKTVYHVVERGKTLVYDHGGNDDRPPLFRVTVTFADVAGKTEMRLRMTLKTPDEATNMRKFIKDAGGNATWDRLAEYLAKTSAGEEKFVINRTFDAPIEVLFQMWTDPEHLARWLPPTGMQMEFLRVDIRPGGKTLFFMHNADVQFHGRMEHLAVDAPDCIVYTQQFCDAHENLARHPGAPTWPATMLTTVKLVAEGAEQTRVTVTWEPLGACTRAELEAFINARSGMTQGWTGSFDKLEALLATNDSRRSNSSKVVSPVVK
jgi:uncharacterized protein YndB with AHSA1/START domain